MYPAGPAPAAPPDVMVSRNWDDATRAALAAGKKAVLFPTRANTGQSLSGSFLPVFWSPVWFPTQKPNTMGILCDPKHPLFALFPTECHSNWQWYDLIQQSRSLILDDTPADFRPIVQVIDNFARNHKLGNVFETRVGEGRLLVCTMDLLDKLDRRPAAKQLLRSLYGYVASDRFQPAGQLGLPALEKLLTPPVPTSTLVRLGARIVEADSEDRENGNIAANAIDGDPETIWHTRWQPHNDPMPHHLVVNLGREVTLQGITCLPRQDMANAPHRPGRDLLQPRPGIVGRTGGQGPVAQQRRTSNSEIQAGGPPPLPEACDPGGGRRKPIRGDRGVGCDSCQIARVRDDAGGWHVVTLRSSGSACSFSRVG